MRTLRVIAFALVALVLAACNSNPGTGEKIGQVIRINYEGMLCKTNEAQLIRGGLVDGSGTMGAPFNFTVPDALVDEVTAAMREQREVTITYEAPLFFGPCSTASGVFLTSITSAEVQ